MDDPFDRRQRRRRLDRAIARSAREGLDRLDLDDASRSRITEATERWGRAVGDALQFVTLGPAGISLIFDGWQFPDADISLLGIGHHRSFAFHSALLVGVLFHFYRKRVEKTGDSERLMDHLFNRAAGILLSGLSLGVGIHLAVDVFQPQSVHFPGIGSLVDGTMVDDNLWLGGNSAICLFISYQSLKMALGEDYPRFMAFLKGSLSPRREEAEGAAPA